MLATKWFKDENQNEWNSFVEHNTTHTFHHYWEWRRTQQSIGNKVWCFGVETSNKTLYGVCLAVLIRAKRGTFLLVPHGPVFKTTLTDSEIKTALAKIHETLVSIAKEERCSFIRVAPIMERTSQNSSLFQEVGYRDAPIFIQSEQSLVLDISRSNDELLADMRKNTRSLLRKAHKYDVEYSSPQTSDSFDTFYKLYSHTVDNQKYFGHEQSFLKAEFESFLKTKSVRIFLCTQGTMVFSAAMIIIKNGVGYYHYGASLKPSNQVPASHLLQWHIIQTLKNEGATLYNFWGVSPEGKPRHPWNGLTLFKKGFGGYVVALVTTKDYILKPVPYFFNWCIETSRRISRHY